MYRCTATSTDGIEFTRKRCTRRYTHALVGIRRATGDHELIGMSMSYDGARRLVGKRPYDSMTVLDVVATEIKKAVRLQTCERCKLQAAKVEQIPMHGYTVKMCQHCFNVALGNGEIV
jgi:hypothetical protein